MTSERGRGTPANPLRLVTQYWTPEGQMLAEYDHIHGHPDMAAHEVVRLREELRELREQLSASPVRTESAANAKEIVARGVAHD